MANGISDYAKRLGVYDEKAIEKAAELHRRIKLVRQFIENEQVKIIFSIDCAAALHGIQCDIDVLLKYSGLKRNDYSNKRQKFEQSLCLAKKITLSEICAMLELNEIIQLDAEYLLGEYKRKLYLNDTDSLPLFMAMAVYQTCKVRNTKVSKTKLCSLKGMEAAKSSWKKLEDEWTQWMDKETPLANRNKLNTKPSPTKEQPNENNTPNKVAEKTDTNNIRTEEKYVPYEEWRNAMIKRAESELKNQKAK